MRNCTVLLAALVLGGCWGSLALGEDKTDEQFMAAAVARAKAEIAWRKCQTLFQGNQQPTYNAWLRLDELNNKTARALNAKLEPERAKNGPDRNQATIDALSVRIESVMQAYAALQRERPALDGRFQQAAMKWNAVDQVFNTLQSMERGWKDAHMDVGVLQAAYEQIAKAADAVRADGEAALNDVQEKLKSFQATCDEALPAK